MDADSGGRPVRREDVFISLCIPEAPATAADVAAIAAAAAAVAQRFRYYEVLIVARIGEDDDSLLKACLAACSGLRVLRVRGSAQPYSRRVVAAGEAIGDVVVITALAETGVLDLIGAADEAASRNTICVFTRAGAKGSRGPAGALLAALGAASRFRISLSDMRTIAIPRTWLNRLLAHPQQNLALRFPPLGEGLPIHHIAVAGLPALPAPDNAPARRLAVIYSLAIHAAPVVLAGVGLLSGAVIAGSLFYVVYAVAALFLVAHLQEGWFTTAIVQAGTACYLALAMLGLSLGLQKLLATAGPNSGDTVVEELTSTDLLATAQDLFATTQELNVAVDAERTAPPPAAAP